MPSNSSLFNVRFAVNSSKSAKPALLAGFESAETVSALAAALTICGEAEVEDIGAALVLALNDLDAKSEGRSAGPRFIGWLLGGGNANAMGVRQGAICALVRRWERLPRPIREDALATMGPVGVDAGRLAFGEAASRTSAARFAADCPVPELLWPLFEAVQDADPRVANAAEESVMAVCERVAGVCGEDPQSRSEFEPTSSDRIRLSGEDRMTLHAQLAGLCTAFTDHRRRGVVAAAMLLVDPPVLAFATDADADPLAKWLLDDSQPSHPSMRSMLRRGTGAMSRRRAWEWLNRPGMMAAAMDRVARAESDAEHEVVAARSHLVENPMRAGRWSLIPTRGTSLPSGDHAARLSLAARRGLPRLVGTSGVDVERAERVLSPLLIDTDEAVRLAAVGVLPGSAALDYAFDPSESIGTAAALKWLYSSGATECERRRVAANLARSPHPRLRWLGQQETVRKCWQQARDTARPHAADRERGELIEELRATIRAGTAEERCIAVTSARRLRAQRAVELELLGLVGGDRATDESWGRVVGAAVSALGEAGTNSALEAVDACLEHPVPRVRANAAEGLVHRSLGRGDLPCSEPRLYASLIEMKGDSSHRVRSSAVRAILRAASPDWGGTGYEPVAADELVLMLEDDRAMHRLAGLWAVEHATASPGESISRRWERLASLVAKLAREESDDSVQRRAMWCARRMLMHAPHGLGELRSAVEECAA